MKTYTSEDLIVTIAWYFLDNTSTVRDTAQHFNISKTTTWVILSKRLEKIDPLLFHEVRNLLEYNKEAAPLRGGMATKAKLLSDSSY